MIAIVDYGMGNLRSVQKAFERFGQPAEIISTSEQVRAAGHIVVPGIGAFCDAIRVLKETGLADAIKQHVRAGKPMLGICLGLQLLADVGYEDGEHEGFGLIAGKVVRFDVDSAGAVPGGPLKVPHMGWNGLSWQRDVPLFKGLQQGAYVYFVHSYHIVPADAGVIAATADYGRPFVAAIWKDSMMATQFHPEKSQEIGAAMLKNFAAFRP